MFLEYLVDKQNKDKLLEQLQDYSPQIRKLNDDSFIVSVSKDGASEPVARILSDINDKAMIANPVVLSNGSAAYFNKTLFPLINDFERKLRKLLYAASAFNKDDGSTVAKLEEKDLGDIFVLLFRDKDYWDRVKTYVNNNKGKGWEGFSRELTDYLTSEKENLLWDRLLPGQVPTLKKRFIEVRLRRNDVMHAHIISKTIFTKSRTLFQNINEELDKAIEEIAKGTLIPEDYNDVINEAIEIYDGSYEIL